MMSIVDRMFGACFRSWAWSNPETSHQKYIDYLPTRKWRYNDQNLMKELSDNNSWEVMDLADDELLHEPSTRNLKLRLHDNVFINPLNPPHENNNTSSDLKNIEPDDVTAPLNESREQVTSSVENHAESEIRQGTSTKKLDEEEEKKGEVQTSEES